MTTTWHRVCCHPIKDLKSRNRLVQQQFKKAFLPCQFSSFAKPVNVPIFSFSFSIFFKKTWSMHLSSWKESEVPRTVPNFPPNKTHFSCGGGDCLVSTCLATPPACIISGASFVWTCGLIGVALRQSGHLAPAHKLVTCFPPGCRLKLLVRWRRLQLH